MILATHTHPTLVLPLLFLYSLPLLHFYRCVAFLPEGGPRVQEWGRAGCMFAPRPHFACSAMEQRLGWAPAWKHGLLGNTWLLLPSSCVFISIDPKYFSLMKPEWLFLWEWCAMSMHPSVYHPHRVIWASEDLYFRDAPRACSACVQHLALEQVKNLSALCKHSLVSCPFLFILWCQASSVTFTSCGSFGMSCIFEVLC